MCQCWLTNCMRVNIPVDSLIYLIIIMRVMLAMVQTEQCYTDMSEGNEAIVHRVIHVVVSCL